MDNQNIKALISSVLAFFGFIFLPWMGKTLQSAGAIIFSDTLYRTIAAPKDPAIWLIVAAIGIGLVSSLIGVFQQSVGRITSWLCLGAGLLAGGYYAQNLPVTSISDHGAGYWTTLIGAFGLIIQILPDTGKPGATRLPAVKLNRKWTPYLFLLPGLILYAFWILYPMAYSFYMSLLRWDFIAEPVFVGFNNFIALFKDPNFRLSIGNNIRWLVVFLTVPTVLGLLLAMMLNRDILASNFFKIAFFFPYVLSYPVIGLVWAWVFNPAMGLVNPILTSLGVSNPPGWLGDRNLAIWVIILAASWRQVGYVMILYLAGLKSIDEQLLEAAQLDGANRWQLFRSIILPLLNPVTVVIVVVSVIDSLRAFDLVSIMTRGGQNTQVLANMMYMETFNNYKMGYGASIAVVLTLLTSIFIYSYLVTMRKQELDY